MPLLAGFSYGLGRLMVDGFYGQLHTTAEAAGLGYGAILEPAAIFTAILIVIGTAATMLIDALRVLGRWIWSKGRKAATFGTTLLVLTGVIATLVATEPAIAIKLLLASGSLTALRTLVDQFGRPKDRRVGQTRAKVDRQLSGEQDARRTRIRTVTSVVLSLGFLLALCFGAHAVGKNEGNKAASGKPVEVRIFGLDVSSMTAAPVHLQPIVSSTALTVTLDFRCYAAKSSQARRRVLISSGAGWSGQDALIWRR